jgi:diguanylate cyclase (GGDEF)-like protein
MGKSSLLNRVIAHAKNQRYETVYLDLREADAAVFTSRDKFLRWFCVNVSKQLKLNPRVDDYWGEDMGSKVSCKVYFEGYLLEQLHSPLLLAVNELNQIFEYPRIAQDFLSMLRYWHEQGKRVELWQKLRLVLVYTTEIYLPLKLNQSPFNVGLSIRLPPLTLEQVQDLAQRYGLYWVSGEEGAQRLAPLVEMVGGHPYLVNVALYHLYRQAMTLEELLQLAPTQAGIYSDHLRNLLALVQDAAELASALRQVVTAEGGVQLEASAAHKLEGLGVIQLDGNQAKPSCELYRLYFLQYLGDANGLDNCLIQSEKQEQEFQHLGNIDINNINRLTQFTTWHYFNKYLETNWQQWTREMLVLSLIVCDVDYFNFYEDAHGKLVGDACIRRIASTINDCVRHQAILAAWYGGTQFAALLPHTDATVAVEIAELIREQVKALGITHDQSKVGGFPSQFVTLSIGVASTTPTPESSPVMLIAAAEEALLQSKRKGRDRVTHCH